VRCTQSSAAQGSKLPVNIDERRSVRLHDAGRPLSLLVHIARLMVRVGGGDDLGRSSGGTFGGHRASLSCRIIFGWREVLAFPDRKMPRTQISSKFSFVA